MLFPDFHYANREESGNDIWITFHILAALHTGIGSFMCLSQISYYWCSVQSGIKHRHPLPSTICICIEILKFLSHEIRACWWQIHHVLQSYRFDLNPDWRRYLFFKPTFSITPSCHSIGVFFQSYLPTTVEPSNINFALISTVFEYN